MAFGTETWRQMEGMISHPQTILFHDHEEVEALTDVGLFGEHVGRWEVEQMGASWNELVRAEVGEEADSQGYRYSFNVDFLSAGKDIPQRNHNTFQKEPSGSVYLEYMEVLRRSCVLDSFKFQPQCMIMTYNVETMVLLQSAVTLFNRAEVVDVTDYAPRDPNTSRPRLFKKKTMDAIASDKKNKVQVLFGNCVTPKSNPHRRLLPDQEYDENQLLFSVVVLGMRMLAAGGSLILKCHVFNNGFFATTMYIISKFFKYVNILKPTVDVDAHREIYVIAQFYNMHADDPLRARIKTSLESIMTRAASYPMARGHLPVSFQTRLAEVLDPFIRFISVCKMRNGIYTNVERQTTRENRRETMKLMNDLVKFYQIKTATKWMLQLQLEQVYYASEQLILADPAQVLERGMAEPDDPQHDHEGTGEDPGANVDAQVQVAAEAGPLQQPEEEVDPGVQLEAEVESGEEEEESLEEESGGGSEFEGEADSAEWAWLQNNDFYICNSKKENRGNLCVVASELGSPVSPTPDRPVSAAISHDHEEPTGEEKAATDEAEREVALRENFEEEVDSGVKLESGGELETEGEVEYVKEEKSEVMEKPTAMCDRGTQCSPTPDHPISTEVNHDNENVMVASGEVNEDLKNKLLQETDNVSSSFV